RWNSIGELFAQLAECATFPAQGFPKSEDGEAGEADGSGMVLWVGGGAALCAALALGWVWRRNWIGDR
ncbi:hypothetical protein KC315_g18845, partial [Hortaea werneckii]